MASTNHVSAFPAGEAIVAASRQVWLASLGAAVVTREWAENEAGALFHTLVKEGTAVESRTFRKVGERFESSFTMANDFWRTARDSMAHTVKQAADTATTLVRDKLPKRLPKVALPAAFRAPATGKRRSGRTAKVAARGTARTANAAKKTVKRVAKRATRRG
ncbi:MAG: phasin family protein [Betaproteobacteria bacterium]